MQIQKPYRETRTTHYPEPVSIVLVKDQNGQINAMSASWFMFTSIEPSMLAVSIGFERHTFELMQAQTEFVLCFPSEKMSREVEFCGSNSGRDMYKLGELGTVTQPSSIVDGVLLAEATANYECRITGSLKTGDHVIFAGEIVASHMNENLTPRIYTKKSGEFGGVSV